jgi:hypothetical protein
MASVIEILAAAEDNIRSIIQYKDNRYLRNLLDAAFIPEKKLRLPEGAPPYTPNPMHEAQVNPGIMWQACAKLDQFQRDLPEGNKALRARIENQFIQTLESVSAKDAEILLAVKEQTLSKLIKGVTYAKLQEVGYYK